MIPLHLLSKLESDPEKEVKAIIMSGGKDHIPLDNALQPVYHTYQNLKLLGFFKLAMERYGNNECLRELSLRVYDIFKAETGNGEIFFIVECSKEALNAFLDDGSVLLKIREWIAGSYREALKIPIASESYIIEWNKIFNSKISPIPKGVKAVPFYKKNFVAGVPAVIIILVKDRYIMP
jgi:hypothetical protein